MTQYYYTDGRERYGPFTIDQLKERNLNTETLVWKEGMADWAQAKMLPELETLFSPFSEDESFPVPPPLVAPVATVTPPKNWLVESILVTLFCCIPLGIVGIVYATRVETLWYSGQYDLALKTSRDAGTWVKIAFFIGLAFWVIFFIFFMGGLMAGLNTLEN